MCNKMFLRTFRVFRVSCSSFPFNFRNEKQHERQEKKNKKESLTADVSDVTRLSVTQYRRDICKFA